MQRRGIRRKKLSLFTYIIIFSCIASLSLLLYKELDISSGIEEILYQKDTISSVEQENKYYINKLKNEYGIMIEYGDTEKSAITSVNANVQYDINIVNNNIKIIYKALKKYPDDMFDIFKKKYSLSIILVSSFNDNNIALASKNNLNQYKIYLSNDINFERAFHHEFFHIIEYYMSDNTNYLYYSWNSYNPSGFKYQEDISKLTDEFVYNKVLSNSENQNAYFLTKYSKTSEKEDRAEMFAELMTLSKNEIYLKRNSKIYNKIIYLMNEIYENVSIKDFHFSQYIK